MFATIVEKNVLARVVRREARYVTRSYFVLSFSPAISVLR
jgi:hypothetical protein